jgi:hypothetical protein
VGRRLTLSAGLTNKSIQVLQEVAAARRILIMCGAAEMDGYVFCLGLQTLKLSHKAYPELQSLIRAVTYLIRGAIFRPQHATSSPETISLNIRPLGELIEMFHTHQATLRHDKVYALLGMSSDDPVAAGLSPDYEISWKELIQRFVKFLLCKEISVETSKKREITVFTSKGCIIGRVSAVERDSARYDRQHLDITFKNTPGQLRHERELSARWTIQAPAKSVRQGDLICRLQGAPKLTIIRISKDHFAIIMIAVTSQGDVRTESGETPSKINSFPHDFVLAWNWERSPENL